MNDQKENNTPKYSQIPDEVLRNVEVVVMEVVAEKLSRLIPLPNVRISAERWRDYARDEAEAICLAVERRIAQISSIEETQKPVTIVATSHPVPADWWQAFKERWFPKWMLKRYPVRFTYIDTRVEKYVTIVTRIFQCPHILVDHYGQHVKWALESKRAADNEIHNSKMGDSK